MFAGEAVDIQLRGVHVHNLKNVDLDIPHNHLVAFCGVSGSGKTSLALDTLYAEGQRRYIESFSAYTRQFLDRLEKPSADRIDGIPPAIAVTRGNNSRSSRSTIGTATETADYLRLLFARVGEITCHGCQNKIQKDSPQSVTEEIYNLPDESRFMVGFTTMLSAETLEWSNQPDDDLEQVSILENYLSHFLEDGFVRVIVAGTTYRLEDERAALIDHCKNSINSSDDCIELLFIVDRLVMQRDDSFDGRLRDSLEIVFSQPESSCVVSVEASDEVPKTQDNSVRLEIDGRVWHQRRFSAGYRCDQCNLEYAAPEPRLYSFNSPLGACTECEGFGNIIGNDMELIVPDPGKSIREGAIAPWKTPAYEHELQELLALADDYDLPVDIPFSKLSAKHLKIIHEGVPEREFGGLNGFFAWLERRKYKMHLRVFLSRWRSYRQCPKCCGARLKPESLATKVGGKSIAEICQLKIQDAINFFKQIQFTQWQKEVARHVIEQIHSRLHYLNAVGLGYLTLDRTLRTLSGGEAQRVSLTTALGSNLVNMLYVLDEPTVGLHPKDVRHLCKAIVGLRDRGNTVIVVDHEEEMLRNADQLIEVGPGAGDRGGKITFQGTLDEMLAQENSLTGSYMTGARGVVIPERRRPANRGWLKLQGASGNNLKDLTVEFPLGVLCLVTGVSGSGKSTLVQDTLYGAVCRRKRKDAPKPLPYKDIVGDGQIDDVVLVDQSPIGRSPRSNPVTYIKAFDQIRAVFADTLEARTHNYSAGHFSFNVDGGRCSVCKGEGQLEIDMQFLADVYMKCPQCGGTRYRDEILDVTYRGLNIADVLSMTVREAFSFFRGQNKVQAKLKRLIDVGLDYLQLGQPANTLSSGEAQRLKLAAYISTHKRNRTLFILDEPSTGLHFNDILQLQDCFDTLLTLGHSLIVVEHNLQLMKAADYIIDIGPDAADEGGTVIAEGTPEDLTKIEESYTGRFLREVLDID
ncbi:MAG: excinuclease ABC subunit A [Planctomycetaceae bacterium]|nr:excinuclease ABC subunit A [Planctomycetaceae bacterium]